MASFNIVADRLIRYSHGKVAAFLGQLESFQLSKASMEATIDQLRADVLYLGVLRAEDISTRADSIRKRNVSTSKNRDKLVAIVVLTRRWREVW